MEIKKLIIFFSRCIRAIIVIFTRKAKKEKIGQIIVYESVPPVVIMCGLQ
jgi:hypothetical protein